MSRSVSFRTRPLTEILVDDDPSRVIRLDLSDTGVLTRLKAAEPRLQAIGKHFADIKRDSNVDTADACAAAMLEAEPELADIIDGVFNAKVCAAATGSSSLFTLDDGMFLFERIVAVLGGLYSEQMEQEANAHRQRIDKHTAKYRAAK